MRPVLSAALAALLLPATALADFADHWAAVHDVGLAKSPRRGASRIVVVPVVVEEFGTLDLADLREFFEGQGDDGFSAYFRDQSLGTYEVTAEVVDPVVYETCPLPAAQFPDCRIARGDTSALLPALDLLRDVFRRADEAGLDATRYDRNGPEGVPDGIADGAMVVTNLDVGGIALPIYFVNTGSNLAGGLMGPFVLDGIALPIVAIAPDRFVAVHEFGHVLGLTDLYDESKVTWGLAWSLMGSWAADDAIPGLDAPSRVALGWAHVRTVRGTERVVLPPVESSGEVVALGAGPEHFLVENRGPGRWDRAMTARGLAVYHVDWNVGPQGRTGAFLDRLRTCVQCSPWHPFAMNVQADGLFELQDRTAGPLGDDEGDLFLPGDSLVPDPSGLPLGPDHRVLSSNLYDGTATGIEIRDIEVDEASGEVSFTAVAPDDVEPCAGVACPRGERCVDGGCWLDDGAGGSGGAGEGGSGGTGEGGSGGAGEGGSGGTGEGGSGGRSDDPPATSGSGDGGGCTAAGDAAPGLLAVILALGLAAGLRAGDSRRRARARVATGSRASSGSSCAA